MNKIKLLLLPLICIMLLTSCAMDNSNISVDKSTPLTSQHPTATPTAIPGGTPETTPRKLTMKDFDFLKEGMSYPEIISHVGGADGSAGSGFIYLYYDLEDGTVLILNFLDGAHGLRSWENKDPNAADTLPLHPNKFTKSLTRHDFDYLKGGDNYYDIIKKLGNPSASVGSGENIVRYDLTDGSHIILHFGGSIYLLIAQIQYPDGKEEYIVK